MMVEMALRGQIGKDAGKCEARRDEEDEDGDDQQDYEGQPLTSHVRSPTAAPPHSCAAEYPRSLTILSD